MDTRRRRALIESFEPRIMYSAGPGPAGLAAAVLTAAEVQVEGGDALQGAGTELVFIDARVPELQLLLDDLAAQQQGGRAVEVVVIGADEDGIAVVGDSLAGRTDVAAIHLIGHGADGVAELGAGRLDAASLVLRAGEISAWGDALTAEADLLIYGCDVASTPVGESLVDALAALTGADVAASDDPTGAASLGGDWDLEYRSGGVEAAIAPGLQVQQDWGSVLAISANGSVSSTNGLNTNVLTWSHTVASGSDRALFVEISIGTTGTIANSVSYGGTALTLVGRSVTGTVPVEIWRLLNPTVGTANVVVTLSAATSVVAGATTYNGVNQSSPVRTFYSAFGNSTNSSVTVVDSAAGDLVIDVQSWAGRPSGGTVGPGQTLNWAQVNTSITSSSTSEPGAASVVMSGSFTSAAQWVIGAVAIRPSAGITVTPISGLTVTEAGGTAQFSVVLDAAPTANVTIGLSSSDTTEGTLSASSLTFTPLNWNVAQTVTVTGVDDSFIDGNVAFTVVTAAASSTDGNYNGRNASDVSLTNTDNDTFNTLVVDTAADTADGTTTSIAALMANKGADGKISLREAITAANNTANGVGGADRISFNIATALVGGTHTITPTTSLPTITDAVVIDGTSEPDYVVGRPVIEIDGSLTGSGVHGLVLAPGSGGSTIRGLAINGFNSNDGFGLYLQTGSDNNLIAGNVIGLDADGTTAVSVMNNFGIYVASSGNLIGGTTAAARNVLSNNINAGIGLWGSNNVVIGNYIGTDATGTLDRGNAADGVDVFGGSNNRIGGVTAAERNIISGNNRNGIEIAYNVPGTLVQGNYIGTDAGGTLSLGNSLGGIWVGGGATRGTIGGTPAGAGQPNVDNPRGGLYSDTSGVSFTLLGNTFDSNSNLAIDLRGDGVTANDAGDADSGANNLQNFPVLTSATTDGSGQLRVKGSLNSTANSYYRIEFFANVAQDASGYGEGQTWLGFANVATDASGNASIDATLSVAVPVGRYISATATRSDSGYSSFTDTSEFSRNVAAVSSSQASITVDTASDTNDGDTTSLSTLLANKGADGKISLREAITAANNTANGAGGADKILFSIAGSGPHSIALGSALPTITGAVIIDGSSEPDFAGTPVIELSGAAAGTAADTTHGLVLGSGSSGSTIKGLVINRFAGSGIQVDSGSGNNLITGNYLGTDTSGLVDLGNGKWGIDFKFSGGNNVVGGTTAALRNVIGGNEYGGIALNGAAVTGNLVLGNYIGVGSDGSTALGNGSVSYAYGGVLILGGATGRIGGGVAGGGNVITNGNGGGGRGQSGVEAEVEAHGAGGGGRRGHGGRGGVVQAQ
ncbi:DUF4347 domain-containing protein, partial [Zoogloea ramigera]|uniref:DUF4347 domain-containing protein n=1 Tax=Zoogloea ramigera TaxID=350 RepID=UPI003FA335D5